MRPASLAEASRPSDGREHALLADDVLQVWVVRNVVREAAPSSLLQVVQKPPTPHDQCHLNRFGRNR